jgi:putative DeoR family transcriptional regulator (stage III sporulation protein D)
MNNRELALNVGSFITETRYTLKRTAEEFGISESTVRRLVRKLLPEINPDLANRVSSVIDYHKAVKHIRGGEATRIKFKDKNRANNLL